MCTKGYMKGRETIGFEKTAARWQAGSEGALLWYRIDVPG